jgi:hypothetical protein
MTTLTLRYLQGYFVVIGPHIKPHKFKSRPEAKDWYVEQHPGSPIKEIGADAARQAAKVKAVRGRKIVRVVMLSAIFLAGTRHHGHERCTLADSKSLIACAGRACARPVTAGTAALLRQGMGRPSPTIGDQTAAAAKRHECPSGPRRGSSRAGQDGYGPSV